MPKPIEIPRPCGVEMSRDNDAIDYTVGLPGDLRKQQPGLRLGQLIRNAERPREPCPDSLASKTNNY